jgi:hypothetical protein
LLQSRTLACAISVRRAMQLLRGYISSLERIGLSASYDDHIIIRKHIADLAVLATTARCPIGESKPPPKRLLAILRELAQEYKAFLSDEAARRVVDWQAPGPVRSRGAESG